METKIEREWKPILCPGKKEKTLVMFEWNIVSEKGRILKRTLKQMDCRHPNLTVFGGTDCNWKCEEVIANREK